MPVDLAKLAAAYGASHNPNPPRHLGNRYDATGQFLREPGNTVVCHLVSGSATERALAAAQERFRSMPEAAKLAFTPLQSYHMTLFQGVIEGRRHYPYWPADLASDAAISDMTDRMGMLLARLPALPTFRVEVTAVVPTGLVVDGIAAQDRYAMAEWRNSFAQLFGYRHPDHDSYQFHITLAYLIDWLDDAQLPAWAAMLEGVEAEIRAAAPVMELRPPAFCSFEDMNWFEELRVLPFAGRAQPTEWRAVP